MAYIGKCHQSEGDWRTTSQGPPKQRGRKVAKLVPIEVLRLTLTRVAASFNMNCAGVPICQSARHAYDAGRHAPCHLRGRPGSRRRDAGQGRLGVGGKEGTGLKARGDQRQHSHRGKGKVTHPHGSHPLRLVSAGEKPVMLPEPCSLAPMEFAKSNPTEGPARKLDPTHGGRQPKAWNHSDG